MNIHWKFCNVRKLVVLMSQSKAIVLLNGQVTLMSHKASSHALTTFSKEISNIESSLVAEHILLLHACSWITKSNGEFFEIRTSFEASLRDWIL